MTLTRIFVWFLFTSIAVSCNKAKTHEELVGMFSNNKQALDSLIAKLKSDKTLDSVFRIGPDQGLPDLKRSYPNEYDILIKVGITDASSHSCDKVTSWYSLRTNWPSQYPIFLIFSPCDSLRTFKGFYNKDKYSNEWWGLGENWQMFSFVKTIDYIKR